MLQKHLIQLLKVFLGAGLYHQSHAKQGALPSHFHSCYLYDQLFCEFTQFSSSGYFHSKNFFAHTARKFFKESISSSAKILFLAPVVYRDIFIANLIEHRYVCFLRHGSLLNICIAISHNTSQHVTVAVSHSFKFSRNFNKYPCR